MSQVVIADPFGAEGIAMLRRDLDVVEVEDLARLSEALPGAEALVVRSRTRVTADLLRRGDNLRLVGRAGIGVDNIDVPAATERGVLVINAPWGSVRSVAEHVLGLIFALARGIPAADRSVREGRWKNGYQGMQLAGKRLGVIGAGKIGRATAGLAKAIGMDVVAFDPYLDDATWNALDLPPMPLNDLLTVSDVVTLHLPLTAETRGMIGARQLDLLRPDALVINCARGGLIDETALASALSEGRLGGAALDVLDDEPIPADSVLLTAPNLILTPHVAASTREAQSRVSIDLAEDILRFFAGDTVSSPINPSVLERV